MYPPDAPIPCEAPHDATWLAEWLEPHWGRGDGANYVAAVVPRGFVAYARVLHPARALRDGRAVTWTEVAALHGRTPHAEMQWHAISRSPAGDVGAPPFAEPSRGHLPLAVARALVRVLRRHTATPGDCRFAVWEGWGGLDAERRWPGAARLRLPGRTYVLLGGPIEAALGSLSPHHEQSASLWWPADRAWCVATEVDLMWTYVGGTRACIEDVLAEGDLEAWRATSDDRVDVDGDRVNR